MFAYVFPGQGSQSVGIGKGLFEEFSELTKKADAILGYSIEALCLQDPQTVLGNTQYTQPALYTVNAFTYLKKLRETPQKPDYVAGHSLGEYNALFAAGVFDFETGLKLVKKRGELMSKAEGGGMAAVVGLDEKSIRSVLQNNHLDRIDVANLNTPVQTVISGIKEDIQNAQKMFEDAGALKYVPLAVSGAFHSRYMETAKREFKKYIDQFDFSEPQIKVISNYTARPYKSAEIKSNMAEQMTGSVKWVESIRYMMGKDRDMLIEQIGPGNVLKGMLRSIKKDTEPLIVEDDCR